MPKAKTIDRLELTRQKFGGKLKASISTGLEQSESFTASKSQRLEQENDSGLKVCPTCGSKSLKLDGGCMSCLSCGWSACG